MEKKVKAKTNGLFSGGNLNSGIKKNGWKNDRKDGSGLDAIAQVRCLDRTERAHCFLSLLLAVAREGVELDKNALLGFYEVLALVYTEIVEINTILRD